MSSIWVTGEWSEVTENDKRLKASETRLFERIAMQPSNEKYCQSLFTTDDPVH
jgi:hypothetical protein